MTGKELIESGIIVLYCLGIADTNEKSLVEQLAASNKEVEDEIIAVRESLAMFAIARAGVKPLRVLKEKILANISLELREDYPPKLTSASRPEDWMDYLNQQKITDTAAEEPVTMVELPGTKDYFTYVVFGSPGGIVDEEMHPKHEEFLLVCRGECEMTIGAEKSFYNAGSFISIAPGVPHSGRITGNERMIVVAQRRAA